MVQRANEDTYIPVLTEEDMASSLPGDTRAAITEKPECDLGPHIECNDVHNVDF